ncbi:lysine-specific demethylase JMJ30-like [Argonauta hians]
MAELRLLYVMYLVFILFAFSLAQLLPLGKHTENGQHMKYISTFPTTTSFYNDFVKPEIPLLMKNVLTNANFPILKDWTDEYLCDKYGNLHVRVEQDKKEDRSLKPKHYNFKKFLESYVTDNIYMVQSVPNEMKGEVTVPSLFNCGGFQKVLQDSVLWLSSGNTRSVLHFDDMDNINCVLDGQKVVLLFNKAQKELIEADGFNKEGSYSKVDVDAVNLDEFPKLRLANWSTAVLDRGDCLYIPHGWYHQFRSNNARNLAINFWFSHLWWLNESNCDSTQVTSHTHTLEQMAVKSNNEQVRSKLLSKWAHKKIVSNKEFIAEIPKFDAESRFQVLDMIDSNHDGNLSWNELYSFDIGDYVLQTLTGTTMKQLETCENSQYQYSDYDAKHEKYARYMQDM